MYRGFMRLEVNEEDENSNIDHNGDGEHERPSITAIMEDDDEDGQDSLLSRDGDKIVATTRLTTANYPRSLAAQAAHAAAAQAIAVSSSSAARPAGMSTYSAGGGAMTTVAAVSSSMPTATISSGSSSNSLASTASSSSSTSSFSSRDQMEVEMRLGTGGSVSLMEYYRTIEFTYFSTVEPVGR
jgi:hypothetical protein